MLCRILPINLNKYVLEGVLENIDKKLLYCLADLVIKGVGAGRVG